MPHDIEKSEFLLLLYVVFTHTAHFNLLTLKVNAEHPVDFVQFNIITLPYALGWFLARATCHSSTL